LKFDAALLETLCVGGIDQVDDAINIGDVVPPSLAGRLVSSQVPGFEGNLAHGEFLGVWLLGGIHLLHDILFEAKEERGLAGIV
jgi:hypothetical protein